MPAISIIIPTLNEESNIEPLLSRINQSLQSNRISYEIIFIDDNSTDRTREFIKKMQMQYPVSLYIKVGKQGRSQSLGEGFPHAKADIIAIIDADLQYPPEALPEMYKKIKEGTDIVVANRKEDKDAVQRSVLRKSYETFFGKTLHRFDCDVLTGMKMFRKQIVERLNMQPRPWSFGLEFLIKSRNAAYKINTIDITHTKRYSGIQKTKPLKTAMDIAITAIALRFTRPDIVPFHPDTTKIKGNGFHYKGSEFVHHSPLHHNESAFHRLSGWQIFIITYLFILLSLGFYRNWHFTATVILAVLTILYFADLLFNLFLIYRSFSKMPEIQVHDEELGKIPDQIWPTYTVFCPLYKEWQVLPQFVTAMSRLEYPKEKLQVMLLLEQDDAETIKHVKKYRLPSYFETVIVPQSKPKTKPKALNYGLHYATGEYAVIYDAEDIPDPKQLKKAVYAFHKAGKRTKCVQAKLNFYNPRQNLLTRVFTAEYSLWFELVLTGLQSVHAPIPLGGTSNHFKTEDLKDLKAWDSFNVTEDCDLGMRLVKRGFRTAVVDSITLEEANSNMKNWFGQRTRWIKGYMQTYLLHMRDPKPFFRKWDEPHAITFQLVIGGKIMSMFINPLMWIITFCYFAFRAKVGLFIESFFPTPILYMGITSLVLGNFLYMYYYMIGCAKHGHDDLVKYVFLVPFYWLAMSLAAWAALFKLITEPHYWTKTKHGLHLKNNKAVKSAKEYIRNDLVDEQITQYTAHAE